MVSPLQFMALESFSVLLDYREAIQKLVGELVP